MKERLKQIRKQLKMTQSDFSNALGVTRTAYAKYENGLVTPSDTFIQLLCSKFHINEEWLRTGNGSPDSPSDSSLLDEVAQQYKLSPEQKEMVEIIMSFPDDVRQKLATALLAICREMAKQEQAHPSGEVDADEARRQVIEKELAAERASKKGMSSASTPTSDGHGSIDAKTGQ